MSPLKFLFTLVLFVFAISVNAQRIVPKASLSKERILIGEQVKLRLELQLTSGLIVKFGEIILPNQIEILDKGIFDTLTKETTCFLYKELLITAFDSGNYTIPPMAVIANGDTFFSKKLILKVASINVDTTGAIKDIITPLEADFSFKDWVIDHIELIIGALAIILMGYLLFYFIRKERIEQELRTKTPYEIAIEHLNQLKNAPKEDVKAYYMHLTVIVREYIENAFEVAAMEQTSREIISNLSNKKFDKNTVLVLKELLSLSDKVKFAKLAPNSRDIEDSYVKALGFINRTKPVEEKEDSKYA